MQERANVREKGAKMKQVRKNKREEWLGNWTNGGMERWIDE